LKTKGEQVYREVIFSDSRNLLVGVYKVNHNSRRVVRDLIKIEKYDPDELVLTVSNNRLGVPFHDS